MWIARLPHSLHIRVHRDLSNVLDGGNLGSGAERKDMEVVAAFLSTSNELFDAGGNIEGGRGVRARFVTDGKTDLDEG